MEYYNRFVVGHRRQFSDTYELGPLIGKGAFGKVYLCSDKGKDPKDASNFDSDFTSSAVVLTQMSKLGFGTSTAIRVRVVAGRRDQRLQICTYISARSKN